MLKHEIINFTGGNIKNKFSNWEKITNDKFILNIIKRGLKLEFIDKPLESSQYPRIKYNTDENLAISLEIKKLLTKKVIEPCKKEGGFISNIFTRPKKDGTKRMILNLKKFNENIEYKHFKMESLNSAIELIKKDCYMASVDLKDAFYSIPVSTDHTSFLKFEHHGKFYKFNCMPMGYGPSMRIFTKVLKPVYAYLRQMGLESVIFVDDNLLLGDTYLECRTNVLSTVNQLQNLGFTVHADKSIFEPTQCITFLGFVLNSNQMTIRLSTEKQQSMKTLCLEIISSPKITIRKLACVIGKIVSSFPAVKYGKLHYRELEIEKISALKNNQGNFDKIITLSLESIKELIWWSTNILTAYKSLIQKPFKRTIFCDASKLGWGIYSKGVKNGGRWMPNVALLHINELELLAIYHGVRAFCAQYINVHIKVMCDNATAVSYINNMGGTKSLRCNQLSKTIWRWCEKRSIWLTSAFIPGIENTEADTASRKFNDNTEWMLNPDIFTSIANKFGWPKIDLFATLENRQIKNFVSWKPDPMAMAIDAFSIKWTGYFFYMFPPFSIIGRTLSKIQLDGTKCIMITPNWPTQPWYPRLKKMSKNIILLPPSNDLLKLATQMNQTHPLAGKLGLMACLILP